VVFSFGLANELSLAGIRMNHNQQEGVL